MSAHGEAAEQVVDMATKATVKGVEVVANLTGKGLISLATFLIATLKEQKRTKGKARIHRFIRLTELIPLLLDMVDDKRIAFNPAVELSYLPIELQTALFDVIESEECTLSLSQAMRMKQAAQQGKLNRDGMELVMREEKPQQNNITIKGKKLERYFPRDFTPAQKEERIIKALDLYCRRLEKRKQENEFER